MKKLEEKEMSFLDHLEELRWHIIRSLIAIMIFAILAFLSKSIVFGKIILGPSKSDFLGSTPYPRPSGSGGTLKKQVRADLKNL